MRRIQLVRVTQAWETFPTCEHTTTLLQVYGPRGKAVLEHEREVLLTVIACMVCRGTHPLTQRLGWQINDARVDDKSGPLTSLLLGYDPHESRERPMIVKKREIVFDAGEIVHAGDVVWKVELIRAADGAVTLAAILTPSEMLFAAAQVLLKS
jgi:hypothetical protein